MLPDYEQLLEHVYTRYLRPGDIAIDVGAHVGRHTVAIARAVHPGGRVVAFEALPVYATNLRDTILTHYPDWAQTIEVHACAVGEVAGFTEFHHVVNAPWNSGLRERSYDVEPETVRIPVEVRALDSLAPDLPSLAYIKVDVEGGELGVLRGASMLLRSLRPMISFEFGDCSIWAYGITSGDMADFLAAAGYVLFDIHGRKLGRDEFIESSAHQRVWDYVALPAERSAEASRLFPPDTR